MARHRKAPLTAESIPERFRHGFPAGSEENPLHWQNDLVAWANAHPKTISVRRLVALMLTAPEPTPAQELEELLQRSAASD